MQGDDAFLRAPTFDAGKDIPCKEPRGLYIDIATTCTGVEVSSNNLQRHVRCYDSNTMDACHSCSELHPSLFSEVLWLNISSTRCLVSQSTAENQKVCVTKYGMLEVRKEIH